MSNSAHRLLDADQFLAWAEGRPGRWELHDGEAVLMAPERAIHALTKYAVQEVLKAAISRAGLPCRMFPDGMTVRVSSHNAFEPDTLVVCPAPAMSAIEIPNPVIVVEVLSPSTQGFDASAKLEGYFTLASVAHYLILDPDRRILVHHKRGGEGVIETRVLREGSLRLDPPGLDIAVTALFVEA